MHLRSKYKCVQSENKFQFYSVPISGRVQRWRLRSRNSLKYIVSSMRSRRLGRRLPPPTPSLSLGIPSPLGANYI